MKGSCFLAVLFVFFTLFVKAQTIWNLHLYSYNYALFNPAAAGAEDKHVFALNGRVRAYYNSYHYSYGNGIASYNGNIKSINSGIGITLFDENLGRYRYSNASVSYNYKVSIKDVASLRLGIRPTFVRTSINYNGLRGFSDPTRKGIESDGRADLDLGLWATFKGLYFGVTKSNVFVNHLKIYGPLFYEYQISKYTTVIIGKKIKIPHLEMDPSVTFLQVNSQALMLLSNNLIIGKYFMLGGNYTFSLDRSPYYHWSVNSGINFGNNIHLVGLVYSKNYIFSSYIRQNSIFFEGMIKVRI